MVYVQNKEGKPLMPTQRHGKVRRMLRDGRAVMIQRIPFTIRLTYDTTNYVQDVTLGVDAGTTHVGLSATTETKELYETPPRESPRLQAGEYVKTQRQPSTQTSPDCSLAEGKPGEQEGTGKPATAHRVSTTAGDRKAGLRRQSDRRCRRTSG